MKKRFALSAWRVMAWRRCPSLFYKPPRMPRKKIINRGQHLLFLPKGAEQIIKSIVESRDEWKEKAVWELKYKLLLSSIVERCQASGKQFVPVSQRVQDEKLKLMNGQCSKLLKDLQAAGLLIIDKSKFKVGEHSWEYKAVYNELAIIRVDKKLINKRNEEILSEYQGSNIQLTNCEKKYLNVINKLSIDKSVLQILSIDTVSTCFVPDGKLREDIGTCFVPTDVIPVIRIMEGKLRLERPDKRSRIYTNITNLSRKFRPYLRLNGKQLMGIDIANSQPMLAAIIFREYSKKQYGFIKDDVLEYQSMCELGLFYEDFMTLNNVQGKQRGAFKKKFFGKVFFTNEYPNENEMRNQFKEKYPICYEALFAIKGGFLSKSYADFAIGLQRIEAGIIVNANFELIEMGIDCVNIFDSLYVTSQEHLEIAKQLILDKFAEYEITPMLKDEVSVQNTDVVAPGLQIQTQTKNLMKYWK